MNVWQKGLMIHVGSALSDLGDEAPEDFIVHGPNRITALPMEVPVCYQEIAHCLDKTVAKVENASSFSTREYATRALCGYREERYLSQWRLELYCVVLINV